MALLHGRIKAPFISRTYTEKHVDYSKAGYRRKHRPVFTGVYDLCQGELKSASLEGIQIFPVI
jgi:hypothetical protein